jgi:hypothetical protein
MLCAGCTRGLYALSIVGFLSLSRCVKRTEHLWKMYARGLFCVLCVSWAVVAGAAVPSVYGKTNVVKFQTVATDAVKRKIYVGTGCRMAILNGDTFRRDMTGNVIFMSAALGDNCSANVVNGVGVGVNSGVVLAAHSTQVSVFDVTKKTIAATLDLSKYGSVGRITNGFRNSSERQVFFVCVTDPGTPGSGTIVVVQTDIPFTEAKVISVLDMEMVVHDVKLHNATLLYASTAMGLTELYWDFVALRKVRTIATPQNVNDGMDIRVDTAYIAATSKGLFVVDLNEEYPAGGKMVGSATGTGWFGGVRVLDAFALVAADPGMHMFDVSDPTSPTLVRTCKIATGKGWNIDIDPTDKTVFLADYDGGLHIIKLSSFLVPTVVGHFGTGAFATCT